ncbi:MAG TPA: ExeM/NucH family extracellular endonuclease [Anaerolineae bacterium]|nr:ExeM/NucH family extracellular endonuclease [Anaerolineae bacterium]
MKKKTLRHFVILMIFALTVVIAGSSVAAAPADPVINEFVANHTGADSQAFVEVFGDPSTDYSAFTVLEIEGDSSGAGVIDAVLTVGTTNAGGYWTDPEDMENGTITIMLVENFSGSRGTDLDTDNDGTFDSTPWSRIVDDVATTDGGSSDRTYSSTVLGPFFDSNPFGAGGASRIPNSTDTDTTTDWLRNDFDGFGFPGFPGSPAPGEAENTPDAVNVAITVPTDPVGECGDSATLIHVIQGNGLASPDVGSIREIEGIVTGDFADTSTGLSGFFMQEETADFDGDAATSEGIFVFNAGVGSVTVGDTVRVRGTVAEFFGLTELNNVASVTACPATGTTAPASWSLPVASVNDWEWVEGMEVFIDQTLYASGNFNQGRFGEVDLSVGAPLDNPTNVVAPGAPANALQDLNDRSRIQLDDGSNVQNPLPLPPYIGAGNTLRTGDTIPGLTGNVSFSFGVYEIQPTLPVNFTRANVRPGVPNVGGDLTVAAYNVLNYFTTIDNAGPICGPLANQGCRGADTAAEFTQQRDKIVTAISKLNADVVGLMEIENAPDNTPEADLVAGLNAATAPGTYEYIATGPIGGDAIRVALLYQPASVTPLGAFEVLDSSDDPLFDDSFNRPMLVQSFVENETGEVFTVGVNHLKSKGSSCAGAGDPDIGDGQGNCNVTRTRAAQAIVDFLATDPTGSGDSDYLVIGDLNAYAQEDPVVTIEAGGYTDLIEAFVGTGFGAGAYSFNFFSQSGYLDHGLASETMTSQVTGADFWRVNADEPRALDYNNFNQPALYNPDEFRSSDHDPVVIGLNLANPMGDKESVAADLAALLPTDDKNTDKRLDKAIEAIEASLNPRWWTSEQTINNKKVFDNERNAIAQLELIVASGVPEAGAAQAAIDALVNSDRQLAQIELIAAIARGGSASKIADAEAAMADAAALTALGLYNEAVNAYSVAWDAATKA